MKSFDIETYLMEGLDHPKHSKGKHGLEVTANCPQCAKRKFYANVDSGRFVCFACGFRGRSIVALVSELEDLSWGEAAGFVFKQSVELRRRETIVSLKDRVRSLRPDAVKDEAAEYTDFPLPDEFVPVWNKRHGWRFPNYLLERRVKGATARAWGMGYITKHPPGWEDAEYGERPQSYKNRLIIPIDCPNGRSFTARDMTGKARQKYLNPPGADHSRLLIGWNTARMTGDLVICEGPLDAVKLWQHSIPAVALGGKVLHEAQMNMLAAALAPSTAITVLLDPEEVEAPQETASRLSSYFDNVYVAKLPDGVDPGASSKRQAMDAVEGAKRWKGGKGIAARVAATKAASILEKRWGVGKVKAG